MKIAVMFGGPSTEHEVSVITAVQLMKAAEKKYDVIPIWIDKKGNWWTGDNLKDIQTYSNLDLENPRNLEGLDIFKLRSRIDVAILCFHGEFGEGGPVQGILETQNIPYQGPGILGSSVCMDKVAFRQILASEGISQAKYCWFNQTDWKKDKKQVIKDIENKLDFPMYVKPSRSGSSIGVEKAKNQKELSQKIENALKLDSRILVEEEISDCIEVNMSVLGYGEKIQFSSTEQPIKTDELLSFADKYQKGAGKKSGMASANRRIPAPIGQDLTRKIENIAGKIFRIFNLSGVVRIDFFANPSTEEVFVIEANTIPGSMSFYLWEKKGLEYPKLVEKLVQIAKDENQNKSKLKTSFKTNILQKAGSIL